MDFHLERQYFVQRLTDFIGGLEERSGELQIGDENRLLFRVAGRPFEALVWVDEDNDIIVVTTRTNNFAMARFEEAVRVLEKTLQICWDHCVALSPVSLSPEDNRYDLSMPLFVGGCTFEAFESTIYNLINCAEAIEGEIKAKPKK